MAGRTTGKLALIACTLALVITQLYGANTGVNPIQANSPKLVESEKIVTLTKSEADDLQLRDAPYDKYDNRELPTSIAVKEGSTIWSDAGIPGRIMFEVTNNLRHPINYTFSVNDNKRYVRRVVPTTAYVTPASSVVVTVELVSKEKGTSPDIVQFEASWPTDLGQYQFVTLKTYFYPGIQITDNSKPDIWYTYEGDCSGVTQHNCKAKSWRTDVSIQDSSSGLLKVKSEPVGLTMTNEFISGQRDVIKGSYTSTCCKTKVDITAVDVLGNYRVLNIDIDRKWLSAGEISAIVLGVLLLLILISVIIYFAVKRFRRQHELLNIYPNPPRHRPVPSE